MRQAPPLLIILTAIRAIMDKHVILRVKLRLTPASAAVINDMLPHIVDGDAVKPVTF
jgi:hypothetical protein